jgi:hypothetical protein
VRRLLYGGPARGCVVCVAVTLVMWVLASGFSPAPALAHWGLPTSFGGGQLSVPVGVAVEQSSGGVYVGNFLFAGNDKFDVSHDLLTPPSPFGGGSGIYAGVAVNPTNDDVYVLDAGNPESSTKPAVDTYNPTSGALLSSFEVPGSANVLAEYTVVQIAADSAGNVYVPNVPNNEVQVFDSGGGAPSGGVAPAIMGSGANALSAPTGVAVDSSGNIWIADSGNNRVEEFKSNGTFVKEVKSPGVQAIAVDGADDLFASVFGGSGSRVVEYDAAGIQIDEFGLGTLGESEFATLNSIAIDETHKVVYVADGGNNVVWAFVLAPEVTTGAASDVQQTSATMNGDVELAGSGEITSCEFEYGTTTSYGQTESCSPSAPYLSAKDVSASLTGLTSDTTYHYRLDVSDADGNEKGHDETLTTHGLASIEDESSTAITTSAILRAQIDPFGYDTTCEVQYVKDASFQTSGYAGASTLSCAPEELGHGFGDQDANVTLTGLQIGTTYHCRFIATNQAGTTAGSDQTFTTFGISSFALGMFDQGEQPFTQAGGHPYELMDNFSLNTTTEPMIKLTNGQTLEEVRPNPTDANPKDVRTELPPGLIGNPEATPKCAPYNVAHADCSGATQVGVITVYTVGEEAHHSSYESAIYNLVPPAGLAAQFGARFNGFVTAHIDAKVRTGGDYGVTSDALYISAAEGLAGASVTLWGVPAESSHDGERECPAPGQAHEEHPCPSGAPLIPFLTDPTSCTGALTSRMAVDSWQEPGVFTGSTSEMPGITGCDKPDFTPSIEVQPQSTSTSVPTGLNVDLEVPQNENPVGLAEANLKDALVTLPEGFTVNPSRANGLQACSEAQIELHGPGPASCPDASKIGKVEIETPLLKHPLKGGVYLAAPYENPFGSLLGIYIAVYDPISGVVVKLAGQVEANSVTGQLSARFDQNPQLPFEHLRLELFGGPRAALVTPAGCGVFTASTDLTPWTTPEGADATPSSEFSIDQGCGAQGFAPSFTAGGVNSQAAAYSPFTMTLSRSDRDQAFGAVTLRTPPGLLGVLKSVPLCGEPQAAQGTCPAASRIGHTTVGAGVGSDPVFLPQAGRQEDPVYLTGRYNGAPFGLSIVEHAEAGPFNLGPEGGKPIVVRAAISVDPHTAQITVTSSELSHILQGIPLQVRTINVIIDRPGFIFNPTSCEALTVAGKITSVQGAATGVSSPFEAANCANLSFNPSFKVSTAGRASRADGASFDVKVTSKGGPQPGGGEANISSVKVDLPKQLPSRLTTLQKACLAVTFEANPANCPRASDVGTATAVTPVLANPLTGPAYLVSHGGEAFPDLEIVLQGEGITLVLDGHTKIKSGITSSTFRTVPDAPISSFELKLPTGRYSILGADVPASANYSLCGQALKMPTVITGQNGAIVKQATKITVTGCAKVKKATKKHRTKTKTKKNGKK